MDVTKDYYSVRYYVTFYNLGLQCYLKMFLENTKWEKKIYCSDRKKWCQHSKKMKMFHDIFFKIFCKIRELTLIHNIPKQKTNFLDDTSKQKFNNVLEQKYLKNNKREWMKSHEPSLMWNNLLWLSDRYNDSRNTLKAFSLQKMKTETKIVRILLFQERNFLARIFDSFHYLLLKK